MPLYRLGLLVVLPSLLAVSSLACSDGGEDEPTVIHVGPGAGGSAGGPGGSGTSGTSGQAGKAAAGSSGKAGGAGKGQSGSGSQPIGGSGGSGQAGADPEGGGGSEAGGSDGPGGTGQGGSGTGTAGTGTAGTGTAGTGAAGTGAAGTGAGGSGTAGTGATDECEPATYPSGVSIKRVHDAQLQKLYDELNAQSCAIPKCFLDASHLESSQGASLPVTVKVAKNFTLYELIGSDIDPKGTGAYDAANAYSARVLVDVDLVEKLQALRDIYGGPVTINSGYRSPEHQHELCQSICGQDQCTDGDGTVTCAKNSRHMWGAAADMSLAYEAAANKAGFPYVFHENGGTGPHLHVDMQACK